MSCYFSLKTFSVHVGRMVIKAAAAEQFLFKHPLESETLLVWYWGGIHIQGEFLTSALLKRAPRKALKPAKSIEFWHFITCISCLWPLPVLSSRYGLWRRKLLTLSSLPSMHLSSAPAFQTPSGATCHDWAQGSRENFLSRLRQSSHCEHLKAPERSAEVQWTSGPLDEVIHLSVSHCRHSVHIVIFWTCTFSSWW